MYFTRRRREAKTQRKTVTSDPENSGKVTSEKKHMKQESRGHGITRGETEYRGIKDEKLILME